MGSQRRRDEEAWDRAQTAERHASAREDARKLFEDFTILAREIQDAEESWPQILGRESWAKDWKKIWTLNRSLAFDVRARLLPVSEVREAVLELVNLLDAASDISAEEGHPAPGLSVSIRRIVQIVTAEGIDVMSGYLRGDAYATTRSESLSTLRKAKTLYDDWEADEIERSNAAAEQWAEEQERADDGTNNASL